MFRKSLRSELADRPRLTANPELLRAVVPSQVMRWFGQVFAVGVVSVAARGVRDIEVSETSTLQGKDEHKESDRLFYSARQVNRVGAFLSHVWSAPRWRKALALYYYMNIELAIGAGVVTWLSLMVWMVIVNGPTGMGGNEDLLPMFVGGPMVSFLICFTCGHYLRTPVKDVWLDKFCIHQTRNQWKVQGVTALPEVVASSDRMVILWNETYFERLWCNAEVATFCSINGGADKLDFVPLWLTPWILSTMVLVTISICISNKLFVLIPLSGAYFAKHFPSGAPWLISFLAQYVGIGIAFSVGYLPVVLPAWHSFRVKLENHEQMLTQCKEFKLEHAKCAVESDRAVVEELVAGLFHRAAQPIQEFNRFVNEDVSANIAARVGRVSGIPYTLCLLVFLPLTFSSAANVWGCDEMPCSVAAQVELGEGVQPALQMLTNGFAWTVGILGVYPSTFPVMLSMMTTIKSRFGSRPCLRAFLDLLAVLASFVYMGFHEGFAAGIINTASGQAANGVGPGVLWCSFVGVYLIFLVLWNVYLFKF